MLDATIYYRKSLMDEEEQTAARQVGFRLERRLTRLYNETLVVPRYSVLPFIDDIYNEFAAVECEVINTITSVKWIADLGNWTGHIPHMTPRTWNQDDLCKLPDNTAFVLKGGTNSKKHYWNTHMYAANKQEAIRVFGLLAEDCMIGCQPIYIREWVPLVTYREGINGLPITKEFRLFFYKKKLLCSGFYWQNYIEDLPFIPLMDAPPEWIEAVASRVSEKANFYVVDIGQKLDGTWTVIELNCGEMSGLSCCDPDELYGNLFKELTNDWSDRQ